MASRAALAVLAVVLLVGCAKPVRDDLYVLVPDKDGKTGVLSVESGGQQTVLDQPYASARVTEPGRVTAGPITEAETRQAFGAALDAQPPRPISFVLYFLEARDELTPDSRLLLNRIVDEIARRPAPEIIVIGHTDRVGAVPYNDALSLRRAERVRDELVKVGIAADRIRLAGRGEREPLVPTADEVPEPRNRRVEINVR
ncbi:MAG TPA: OmpA family protein [Methylomirabilota bacterium]|jgi:outer membrane protein OmpA-like peptidoglycan-associated protein|nr:OmpA family protein [Methylomirabilota bacterium]